MRSLNMKGKPSLISFRMKNFKVVQDSKTLRFTPLTVFIGNIGSGFVFRVQAAGGSLLFQTK